MAKLTSYIQTHSQQFEDMGFAVQIDAAGLRTLGGRRGILVTVTQGQGGQVHSLSIESDNDVFHHVRILVDGTLRMPADTLFLMPADLTDLLVSRRYFDWFVDSYLGGNPASFMTA